MGRRVKRGGGEPARGDKEWTVGVIGTYGASKQGQDVHGKMKLRVRVKVAERTQSHVSRNRHSKKREGGGRAGPHYLKMERRRLPVVRKCLVVHPVRVALKIAGRRGRGKGSMDRGDERGWVGAGEGRKQVETTEFESRIGQQECVIAIRDERCTGTNEEETHPWQQTRTDERNPSTVPRHCRW